MKKRIISMTIAGVLVCSLLTGCGNTSANLLKFEKNAKGVVFTAYSAPTANTKVNDTLDEAYKKLAEAGFNKVQALHEGSSAKTGTTVFDTIQKRSEDAENVALEALKLAEKYGLKYWVRDWSFYGLAHNYPDLTQEDYDKVLSKMFDENNQYIDHPAYGGNFGHDEPNIQEMDKIAWQTELYNKYIKQNSSTGGEMFVNLLPIYAAANTLSAKSDVSYGEYVDHYFETIAPHLGYVCWDFYPYVTSSEGENYVREMYYYNLELMARKARENNCELRTFVQAKGDFTGIRNMDNIGDLRFQIYSGMAFGVREFVYYTYASGTDESNYTDKDGYALYNYKNGEHTWVYDAAKVVNNEVHAMEDAYMAYEWNGNMFKNADEMLDNQLFANMAFPITSHERFSFQSCTQDVMAGVFTAKDKDSKAQDAFMIVNVTDPSEKLDNEVTVKFENASSLLMYRLGEEIVVPLKKDGTYTFDLQPGEGRFVIPIK